MPNPNTLDFYKAYVINVKEFLVAEKDIKRTINKALKENKYNTVKIQTKLYALLYSTFSESNFMKMLLTPYGFDQILIDQILKENNIQEKWYKAIDLAFHKFSAFSKSSEIPNKSQDLKRIVQKFVVEPSIIRNKIAHGQFSIAMNKKNESLNVDITQKIKDLDVVNIYILFEINKRLVSIIEDIIESPDKAHYNYYYSKFQQLNNFIQKSERWTLSSKMETNSMKKKILR